MTPLLRSELAHHGWRGSRQLEVGSGRPNRATARQDRPLPLAPERLRQTDDDGERAVGGRSRTAWHGTACRRVADHVDAGATPRRLLGSPASNSDVTAPSVDGATRRSGRRRSHSSTPAVCVCRSRASTGASFGVKPGPSAGGDGPPDDRRRREARHWRDARLGCGAGRVLPIVLAGAPR